MAIRPDKNVCIFFLFRKADWAKRLIQEHAMTQRRTFTPVGAPIGLKSQLLGKSKSKDPRVMCMQEGCFKRQQSPGKPSGTVSSYEGCALRGRVVGRHSPIPCQCVDNHHCIERSMPTFCCGFVLTSAHKSERDFLPVFLDSNSPSAHVRWPWLLPTAEQL